MNSAPSFAFASPVPAESVAAILREFTAHPNYEYAWDNYKPIIFRLIAAIRPAAVLEIGGGRFPAFTAEEVAATRIRYAINDISQRELDLAPGYVDKICFDIASPNSPVVEANRDTYGFVFSKMVFEHVANAGLAYSNIFKMLKPAGICLNFHPVLYSPPFVANKLLPETLAAQLLRMINPLRRDDGIPKFPAYYDRCVINRRSYDALKAIGFSEVHQFPFYGHNYFVKIPGLRELDDALTKFARCKNMRSLASYAFTLCVK
jgi:SAM-dependent methyltransferase